LVCCPTVESHSRVCVCYRCIIISAQLLELALPVVFVAFLLAIKNAVKNTEGFKAETIPAEYPGENKTFKALTFGDYVTAMQAKRQCVDITTPEMKTKTFWITGIPKRGENWQVPFVKCDSRRCKEDGEDALSYCQYGAIGVAGADAGGLDRADAFRKWLLKEYPALATSMPFDFDIVNTFSDSKSMDDYVKSESYGDPGTPKLAMGIVWTGNETRNYIYSLRQNSTNFNAPEAEWKPTSFTTPNTNRLLASYAKDDNDVCVPMGGTPKQGWLEKSCTGQYVYNGLLTFQRLVGDFILADSGAKSQGYFVSESGVSFVPFPTFPYQKSGFYGDLGGKCLCQESDLRLFGLRRLRSRHLSYFAALGPLLITLGLLFPVASMINYVTQEKQKGQKELMKMMSVTESDIGWSWFSTFFLFNIVSATLTAGVSMALFENSKGSYLWIFWVITFVSITSFSVFLAAFASKSNRAVTLGLLLFLVGVFLTFAADFQEGNGGVIDLISLHPAGAMTYCLLEIGRLEDQGIGLQGSSVGSTDSPSGFTFNKGIQSLLINSVLWGVLSWYMNRVVKQDYGQALPLWFPVLRSYWTPNRDVPIQSSPDSIDEAYNSSIPFEVVGRHGGSETGVEIRNLKKVFGKTIAIDGLSLNMYGGKSCRNVHITEPY
jgi:ABC-2 family transporter protein